MAEPNKSGKSVGAGNALAGMSFEEALAELQELVKRLERGDNKLEDAVRDYERGAALKRHCEAKLKEAQLKVEAIVMNADGAVETKPADLD